MKQDIIEFINNQPRNSTYLDVYNQLTLHHTPDNSEDGKKFNHFLDMLALEFDPEKHSNPFLKNLNEKTQLELMDQMRSQIQHPDILWLLYDLYWIQNRIPKNAGLASEFAIKSSHSLDPNKSSYEIFLRIKRAVILSNQSQNTQTRDEVKTQIRLLIENALKITGNFLGGWLIELLIEMDANTTLSDLNNSGVVLKAAIQAEDSDHWDIAQCLRQSIVKILRALKFEDLAQEALIELARSYEKQGGKVANGFLSTMAYQKAIGALQEVNTPTLHSKRDSLKEQCQKKLQIAQATRLSELHIVQAGPIALTEPLLQLEKALAEGNSFNEVLMILGAAFTLRNRASLEADISNQLQQMPLSIFGVTETIDEKGRTIGHNSSFDEQLSYYVSLELSINWDVKARLIDHARQWIINHYSVTESDWLNVIAYNPYIPPNHKEIVAKALHQGLNADFLSSTHILPPQFEATFRYILESKNVLNQTITTTLKQKDKTLEVILSHQEIKDSLDEDYCFEVSRLLTEDGQNLRNNALHGKMTFYSFFSSQPVYLWYLAIKLYCCGPALLQPPKPNLILSNIPTAGSS